MSFPEDIAVTRRHRVIVWILQQFHENCLFTGCLKHVELHECPQISQGLTDEFSCGFPASVTCCAVSVAVLSARVSAALLATPIG